MFVFFSLKNNRIRTNKQAIGLTTMNYHTLIIIKTFSRMPQKNTLLLVAVLLFVFPQNLFSEEERSTEQNIQIIEQNLEQEFQQFFSDNFFRRLFGLSKKTEAQKRSRSQRHATSRPERYSPPPSSSQNPESQGGRNRNLPSSDMSAVRNTPKPPLHSSMRDQYYGLGLWELGLSVGTSHAITDLGMGKNVAFGDFASYQTSNFGLNIGFFTRYRMNEWFALSLGMDFLTLSAENPMGETFNDFEVARFTNDVFEFFTKTELYMPGLSRSPFDLYGFVGIGIFFSDARVYNSQGRLVDLQIDYSQVQPVIPMGVGFAVQVTPTFRVGYEFGWRNTIFHYLDGVKLNGDKYDRYFLNGLKLGLTF